MSRLLSTQATRSSHFDRDNSWSEALFNHHAILIHEDTVAIPPMDGPGGHMQQTSGLMVAHRYGHRPANPWLYDHRPLVEMLYCSETKLFRYPLHAADAPQLVIENMLYSISDLGVMVSRIDAPETPVAMVPTI